MCFREQTFANGRAAEKDKRSPVAPTTGLKYETNFLLHEIWEDISQSAILQIRQKRKKNVAKSGSNK